MILSNNENYGESVAHNESTRSRKPCPSRPTIERDKDNGRLFRAPCFPPPQSKFCADSLLHIFFFLDKTKRPPRVYMHAKRLQTHVKEPVVHVRVQIMGEKQQHALQVG